jgi:large subunit ribosomal protein L25
MGTYLKASSIHARTKGEVKRLRKAGAIPVSLQHKGEETRHYQMDMKSLQEFIRHHGESELITLEIDSAGKKETALLQQVTRDRVTHAPLQAVFQRVVSGEPVKAHVPLAFVGQPVAVKEGAAVLQPIMDHLEVRSLPQNLPDHITIDVSHMEFGHQMHVSDIPDNPKYEVLNSSDQILVSLAAISRLAAEETVDSEDSNSPLEEVAAA